MPFLKEEKSEHERARTSMLTVQPCCARHCELPLSKMGNKGLFPGVAVPLAFFCTLFFRHRKKSVSAPWDGQSLSAPESARQAPLRGNCLRQSCCLMLQAGGLSARPPAPPSDRHPKQSSAPWDGQSQSAPESARQPHRGRGVCACGRTKGLSARPLETFGP